MRKSVFLTCILACGCFGVLFGCGDDADDDGGGGSGDAGRDAGGGGTGGSVEDPDPINADCPSVVGPFTGEYALKGKCCYRRSNSARLSETADTATLEYKANYFVTANHPKTAGSQTIIPTAIDRFDKEEQVVLFRFTVPRKDGEFADGPATIQIGPGRYNCNGTYSFYGDKAAPMATNFKDPARWELNDTPAKVDLSKPGGQQISAIWETNSNKDLSYLPYIKTMADPTTKAKPLDWETVTRGFNILEWPMVDDAIDCVGSRQDSSRWTAGAKTVSYGPLEENHKDPIMALGSITLSQLFAFGTIGDRKDMPAFNPVSAARCTPGESGCNWVKLPDSLCPSDADSSKWRCHVGYQDKADPNSAPTNCTMEAPTGVLDPDKGATSEGQCCDPLAKGTNGLPACNAFRIESNVAAAAVEITDAPAQQIQQNCIVE
jgi:hypothetical protein